MKTPTLKRRILLPLFGGSTVLLGTFALIFWWAQSKQIQEIRVRDWAAVEHSFQHKLGIRSAQVEGDEIVIVDRAHGDRDASPFVQMRSAAAELRDALGVHVIIALNKRGLDATEWQTAVASLGGVAEWDRFAERVLHVTTLSRLPSELDEYFARSAATASGGRDFDLWHDGARYLGAALPLRESGGQGVGEIIFLRDYTDSFASIRRSLGLAVLISLAVGLMMIGLLFRTIRLYFLGPVLELRAVAERAGRGELSRTATIHISDELGDLARSMNRMIQELRDAQEERTRLIVDAALDAVVTMDEAGDIVDWNAQAEVMFGWPRAEAVGRSVAELIVPPEYREPHLRGMKRFLETGESTLLNRRIEVAAQRRNGEIFPAEIAITPLRTGDHLSFSAFIRDITERRQAEKALRTGEERFRRLVETANVIPWEADPGTHRFTYVGPQVVKLLGYTLEQWHEPDFWSNHLHPEDRESAYDFIIHATDHHIEDAFEYRMIAEDGRTVWLRDIITFSKSESGRETMLGFRFDITERKRIEGQLLGSQRMEAVGRLAGGVAHDFNNLITAILGYASLVQSSLAEEDPVREDVAEISRAANRAAGLTQQLLAFARKQVIQPKVLDPNELVVNLEKMLRRLIGEDIRLETRTAPDLWNAKIDPGQFEQVLVNLVVNARDAMPEGGKVVIETANARLKSSVIQRAEVVPGEYVMISVSDTGSGMDQQTVARIFEPFFTTKEVGKGTGLGLATCYGVVKQAGGYIFVYTELGRGTTFKIYVPRAPGEGVEAARTSQAPGGETILLVEDDAIVRDFTERSLRNRGYRVITATMGQQAITLARESVDEIHLLLTDVFMPQMGGGETARAILELRPSVKVLYMSAFPDAGVALGHELDAGAALIAKPFSPGELERRVREVLDDVASALAGR